MLKKLMLVACMLTVMQSSYANLEDKLFYASLKIAATAVAVGTTVYYFVHYGNEESEKQQKERREFVRKKEEITPFNRQR